MKNNLVKLFVLLFAVTFMVLPMVSCDQIAEKPDDAILSAIEVAQSAPLENDTGKLLSDISKSGSAEVNLSLTPLISSLIGTYLPGFSLSTDLALNFKMATNQAEKNSMATAALLVAGANFVDVDFYSSDKEFIVSSDTLLGTAAYGFAYENFSDTLNQFYPMESDKAGEAIRLAMESSAELKAAIKKYEALILTNIFLDANTKRTKEDVTIGDETVSAVAFRAELSTEKCQNAIRACFDAYKNDTETKALVENILKTAGKTDEEIQIIYEDIDNELSAVVTDNETILLSFFINAKAKNLMKIEATSTEEGTITLILGVDAAHPKYMLLSGKNAEGVEEFVFSYQVSEDSADKYASKITISGNQQSEIAIPEVLADIGASIELTHDRKTGAYVIEAKADDSTFSLKGTCIKTSKDITLTVDELNIPGMSTLNIGLAVKLSKEAGTVQTAPATYTDVSKMSTDEIDALTAEIESKFSELLTKLPPELLGILMIFGE